MPKTLFLYLDGLGHNFLNKTTYLQAFIKKHGVTKLNTPPLHQFEFSIFSGTYDHNYWIWFIYNPQNSPYKWIKPFSKLFTLIDKTFLKKPFRSALGYFSALITYLQGRTRLVKVYDIPYNKMPLFSITANKSFIDKNALPGKKMLFDLLREKNITYYASEWPLNSTEKKTMMRPFPTKEEKILDKAIKQLNKKDFVFVHLWTYDSIMHEHGPFSKEAEKHLKYWDKMIFTKLNKLQKKYPELQLIISSDHSQVEITNTVNILEHLKKEGFNSESDFIMLPEPMMIRFWNVKNKEKLTKSLNKIKSGKVFTEKNFSKELGYPYTKETCGDIMFIANSGTQILPNYFDGNHKLKGMHGFVHLKDEMDAFITTNKKINLPKEAPLKDVYYITQKVLGIK